MNPIEQKHNRENRECAMNRIGYENTIRNSLCTCQPTVEGKKCENCVIAKQIVGKQEGKYTCLDGHSFTVPTPDVGEERWRGRIDALHPENFVPGHITVDDITFEHDKKGTIEAIEEALSQREARVRGEAECHCVDSVKAIKALYKIVGVNDSWTKDTVSMATIMLENYEKDKVTRYVRSLQERITKLSDDLKEARQETIAEIQDKLPKKFAHVSGNKETVAFQKGMEQALSSFHSILQALQSLSPNKK